MFKEFEVAIIHGNCEIGSVSEEKSKLLKNKMLGVFFVKDCIFMSCFFN